MKKSYKLITGKEIKKIRKGLGRSLPKLALALNIPPATLRAWEENAEKPSILASKVLRVMQKDPQWLRFFEEEA